MDPVVEITKEIAALEGTRPTALPPLYEAVDPDALAAVVDSAPADGTVVSFTYCGYAVTVDGGGEVDVGERNRAIA